MVLFVPQRDENPYINHSTALKHRPRRLFPRKPTPQKKKSSEVRNMCNLSTKSFSCGHQEASTYPCSSDVAGQCTLKHEVLSSPSPCEECTEIYPSMVAKVQANTTAFEEQLLSALGKITIILDECLYHSDITDLHLRMMQKLIPKIENKLEIVRERSKRAWDLLQERNQHLDSMALAADESDRTHALNMLKIVEESLDNIVMEVTAGMTPTQLLLMWKGSCQLDYCWWVLQNAAVIGELRASGRLASKYDEFEEEYASASAYVLQW